MGICPGQAPMTIDPFCLLRVKVVPSEEDSASHGVLVDLVQSLIAICSGNCAFLSKLPLRQPLKMKVVAKMNFCIKGHDEKVAHELNHLDN